MVETLLIIFIIAFAGWLAGLNFYSLREGKFSFGMRRNAAEGKDAGTPLSDLENKKAVIECALTDLNVSGKWNLDGKEATMGVVYQGGHFFVETAADNFTARIVYPHFYSICIKEAAAMRTFINRVNQCSAIARLVYSSNAETAQVDFHLVVGFVVTEAFDSKTLELYLSEIFMLRNVVLGDIEEVRRCNRKCGFEDVEEAIVISEYQKHLLAEGEMQLQDMPRPYHYSDIYRPLLGNIVCDVMGIDLQNAEKLVVMRGDNSVEEITVSDEASHAEVFCYDLTSALVADGRFMGGSAQLSVTFTAPPDKSQQRQVVVSLLPGHATNEVLYIRVTATVTPENVMPYNTLGNYETQPLARSFIIAYDLVDETRIEAKFNYLWKEATADTTAEPDVADDDSLSFVYMLRKCRDKGNGYDVYRGVQLFLQKRYAEALPRLKSAYEYVKAVVKPTDSVNVLNMLDLCYYIGTSYYALQRYDLATYYLGLTVGTRNFTYIETYVNALIMGRDVRAMAFVSSQIKDVDDELAQEMSPDDDEDEPVFSEKGKILEAYRYFLQCSKAHLLALNDMFDDAEELLRMLVKRPDNKLAVATLAHVRKMRKQHLEKRQGSKPAPLGRDAE